MNKPTKPIISFPTEFATNGVKTDFSETKISDGFDRLQPDILPGDCLNKFIDDTYKGLNYAIAGTDAVNLIEEGEVLSVESGTLTSTKIIGLPAQSTATATQYLMSNGTNAEWTDFTGANQKLSNLDADGNQKIHALKGYLDDGTLLTDSEGLADVKKYAHSTFDADKFSSLMSGGASVNDNGIATGFTISDGQINLSTKIVKKASDSLYVRHEITPTVLTDTMSYFGFKDANNALNIDFRFDNRKRFLVIYRNTNNTTSEIAMSDNSVTAGESYIIELIINGSNIQYKVNGNLIGSASNYSNDAISSVTLGRGTTAGYPLKGTTDLKQLEFVINGVPVFSGNKTGIDTVKADDYTVVGTPTISADGIANFAEDSNNDYITLPEQFKPSSNSWEIYIHCKTGSSWNTAPSLFSATGSSNNYGSLFFGIPVGHPAFQMSFNLDDTQTSFTNFINTTFAPSLNTEYWFKLAYTGTEYQIWTSNNNGITYTLNNSLTSSVAFAQNQTAPFCIGTGRYAYSPQKWYGSIDLNAFKIYVDGDLVYQPCLKIPYTESKTGAKIVDSVYRERVSDMYSQFGYAPYYTLSDTDFTLPMGEVYGMMLNKSVPHITDTYKNGASWYRVWSDGWKQQGGLVSMNQVDETLQQPIIGTNGTLGGTTVAVSGSGNYDSLDNMYYVLGNNPTSFYRFNEVGGLILYFPYKVRLTRLDWNQNNTAPGGLDFKVGNDGINWVSVTGAAISQTATNCSIITNLSSASDGYQYYYLNRTNTTGYLCFYGPLQLTGTYKLNVANTITFPLSFSDTNYSYTFSCESSGGANAYISSKTTSGMNINNTEAGSASWTAMGY